MSVYEVNTEELRQAAQRLREKGAEMQTAIDDVEKWIAPAREMKSPRIAKDVADWDDVKANLQKVLQSVDPVAQKITNTAGDIDDVMNA